MTGEDRVAIRALSVKEPWLAIIMAGVKSHEFRSWRPGNIPCPFDLLLCSTLRPDKDAMTDPEFVAFVRRVLSEYDFDLMRERYGFARAIVTVEGFERPRSGIYADTPGCPEPYWWAATWGWRLSNIRRLLRPFQVKGQLSIFTVRVPPVLLEVAT